MMKINKISLLFIVFCGIFTLNITNVFATSKVENFINNIKNESSSILNDKELSEEKREEKYKDFTNKIVDTNWISKFILGKYWNSISPKQREEFEKSYTKYLLTNYISKLKDYNENLKIVKIEQPRNGVFIAYTQTKDSLSKLINVNFRLIENNNNLFITDIIPEGISFIGSQRTDINSSIERQGFDAFMVDLNKKIK